MAHSAMMNSRAAALACLALAPMMTAGCFDGAAPPPADATVADARLDATEAAVDTGWDVPYDLTVRVIPTNVDVALDERTPAAFHDVALPTGVTPLLPWVIAAGRGYVISTTGRVFTVDAYGAALELERLAGESATPREAPANAVTELTDGEPTVLTRDGAIVVRAGTFRRAALPTLLADARVVARWSNESLWATGAGLYSTLGARWLRLDRAGAPVTDVTAIAVGPTTGTTREAWVLRQGGALHRIRMTARSDGAADVVWSDPVVGLDPGPVRAIASLGTSRLMARADDLLRVDERGRLERLRVPGVFTGPSALVPAGRAVWIFWRGGAESVLGRFDGERLTVYARGLPGDDLRVAADGAQGNTVLLVGNGRVRRLVTEPTVLVTGFADGTVTTEPRLAFQVDPPVPATVTDVTFLLDDVPVERVMAAPFRWGAGGALYRAMPTLPFGPHTVVANVSYRDGNTLSVRRTFTYLSPLGRVPTYEADVAPLYETACARCHSTNIARDLRGYSRLADMAPSIAEVVESRRMPPDLTLDTPSMRVFTAWVSGGSLER